jgi:2-polyprenyl-3-methyl-5-hydroxy-6-metoxy-1,4-benzoquinol methylase
MTSENWQNRGLIEGWTKANGSEQWPFGDNWRLALINPVVLHAACLVQEPFDPKHKESLYRYIALQRKAKFTTQTSSGNAQKAFREWHEHPFGPDVEDSEKLSNLRLLDLGCGEAYRSRWLARFGARYMGIDCSKGLIDVALERREVLSGKARAVVQKHEYMVADLEEFDESKLADKCGVFEPNLICAIASLDHIAKPSQLIAAISMFAQKLTKPAPFLVITLNPGHFNKPALATSPADTLNDPEPKYFGTLEQVVIQSAKNWILPTYPVSNDRAEVPPTEHSAQVYFRSLRDWEELFAPAFHVLHASPLQFSDYTILNERTEQLVAADVSFAVAPFHAWLLYPKKVGLQATNQELEAAMSLPGFFSRVSKKEKEKISKELSDQIAAIRVLDFEANERIAFAHNMGGDACIVMKGAAQLTADDGTTPQTFRVGDMLGELENDWMAECDQQDEQAANTRKYMIRRYPFPIDANSKSGVSLLVLPPQVFQKVANIGGMASFAGELFRNLRDKLLVNIWKFYGERIEDRSSTQQWDQLNNEKFGTGPDNRFGSEKLQRVAKGIMTVASIEAYDPNRPTDGTTIFCGPAEIGHLVDEKDAFVSRALTLFDAIGLIRWIDSPLFEKKNAGSTGTLMEALAREGSAPGATPKERAENKWKEWKAKAFNRLVAAPLIAAGADCKKLETIYRDVAPGLDITKRGFGMSGTEFKLEKAGREEFESCEKLLGSAGVSKETAAPLLCNYLANIGYVNLRIVRSMGTGEHQTGRVIRIVAAHELRRLAFDENEFLRGFADRLNAFPEYRQGRGSAPDSFKQMRALRYVEVVESFLEKSWTAGDCYMSGQNLEQNLDLAAFKEAVTAWLTNRQ